MKQRPAAESDLPGICDLRRAGAQRHRHVLCSAYFGESIAWRPDFAGLVPGCFGRVAPLVGVQRSAVELEF